MNRESIPGLRLFLYTVIDLISQGKAETCANMERLLSKGVASELYKPYISFFNQYGLYADNILQVDDYYKQWSGVADGQEMRKYGCKEENGLALILKLALNEIY